MESYNEKILLACMLSIGLAIPSVNRGEESTHPTYLPDLENGSRIYRHCAVCHNPTGWGSKTGEYPQIAGQYNTVIIKQLNDIREGGRNNPTMYPFDHANFLGGSKNLADVALYIERLPMDPNNQLGPGGDLEKGAKLYEEHCARCHGPQGEGSSEKQRPRIQGQHFAYLLRQLHFIKSGQRHNTGNAMLTTLKRMSEQDLIALGDYASRLKPPANLLAPPGWHNPDLQ